MAGAFACPVRLRHATRKGVKRSAIRCFALSLTVLTSPAPHEYALTPILLCAPILSARLFNSLWLNPAKLC